MQSAGRLHGDGYRQTLQSITVAPHGDGYTRNSLEVDDARLPLHFWLTYVIKNSNRQDRKFGWPQAAMGQPRVL